MRGDFLFCLAPFFSFVAAVGGPGGGEKSNRFWEYLPRRMENEGGKSEKEEHEVKAVSEQSV